MTDTELNEQVAQRLGVNVFRKCYKCGPLADTASRAVVLAFLKLQEGQHD